MCLLLKLCEAFVWPAIWGAVNSNKLKRIQSVLSYCLMFVSIALEETFKFHDIFRIERPSCLKVMMDCCFSLLIWVVLPNRAIFCVPPLPCHNKNDWLKSIKKETGTPVNWNAFQVTSWSWLRECKEYAKLSSRQRVATLKNVKYKVFFVFLNGLLVTTWFHMFYFIVLMSSLLFYNVSNIKNKEKPLNE
jgi:hypothetical protein